MASYLARARLEKKNLLSLNASVDTFSTRSARFLPPLQ